MINDKIQAAIGLNPSLAGTTSPTVDSCWWEHQLLSLNPSLAGTTSPTSAETAKFRKVENVLILLLLEPLLRQWQTWWTG